MYATITTFLSTENTEAVIELSQESIAHVVSMYLSRDEGQPRLPEGETRAKVLDPVKFEPLGFEISELVTKAADNQKANIVACLPDQASDMGWLLTPEGGRKVKRTASWVWRMLGRYGCVVDRGENWVVVSPKTWTPWANRPECADSYNL